MRIVFMGTPAFAVPALEALVHHGYEIAAVVTQPDRAAGRGQRLLASPVKAVALRHGLAVVQPPRLRRAAVVAELRALQPDLMVVAAYGQLLPPEVLAIPPRGCLNVHASLLPKHRGASPVAAAILAGDATTGVTIMRMDEGMDTGDILAQAPLDIGAAETAEALSSRLAALGAGLLLDTLTRWLAGEIAPQPQDHAAATYCRPIRKEDGRIAWHRSAVEIARQVRAYQPWPGSYTTSQGKALRLLAVRPLPGDAVGGEPGRVLGEGSGISVVTGSGRLLLDEVQPEGRRPMSGEAYARGQRNLIGSMLI